MKNYIFVLFGIIFFGCSGNKNNYNVLENINTNCYITKVSKYKYSKIQGYIYYKGIKLDIDNGNTGYYYKTYNLKEGDIIVANITVYQREYSSNNPYKNDLILSTSDLDATKYEIE